LARESASPHFAMRDALDRLASDALVVLNDLGDAVDAPSAYGDAHGTRLSAADANLLKKLFRAFAARDGGAPWRRASDADGARVYRRASASAASRAHQVLGVTETRASADEVFAFFSEASAFDEHFKILDDMFKGGDVLSYRLYDDMVKTTGGEGGAVERAGAGGGEGAKTRRRARGLWNRGANFGELFERLERSAKAKARDAKARGTGRASEGNRSAMETIESVPPERPDASNPLGCRPGHAILRGTFRLPSIIRDRDFVWEQLTMKMPNGAVVVAAQSIENGVVNAVAPPLEGHVRGAILVSGYYAVPNRETGGSTLFYVVQADPKGVLPMWVVNLVAPDQAQNVARLRNHLDGPKK
jgi:hypothetical protein